MQEDSAGVSHHRIIMPSPPNTDRDTRTMDRRPNSFRHWTHSLSTTVQTQGVAKQSLPLRVNLAIFHGAAGVLFAPPGRLLNQDQNLRLYKLKHLLAQPAALPSSCEKASTARETCSGSRGLTKVSLRPFLTNHTAIAGFRPTSTPKHLRSRERSKKSSIHIQTSPVLSLIITFGRRVQPSRGAIETPPRSC